MDKLKKDVALNQKTQKNSEIKPRKKLNFFRFSGRTRRKDFWLFKLVLILLGGVALTLDTIFFDTYSGWGPSFTIFWLILFIPNLAISVRRLHDTGRCGWWFLLGLVPLGGLFLLAFFLDDSEPGTNKYGPNPKDHKNTFLDNENSYSSSIINKKNTPKEKTLREIFEEKAEVASKKKGTNWILIALITTILLSLIGSAFYWFEYRPTQIKKDCSWTEYETGKWREARESEYEKCLRRNGLLE